MVEHIEDRDLSRGARRRRSLVLAESAGIGDGLGILHRLAGVRRRVLLLPEAVFEHLGPEAAHELGRVAFVEALDVVADCPLDARPLDYRNRDTIQVSGAAAVAG